jgi:site-specific DNA-methyltransferase (adenine-specific)
MLYNVMNKHIKIGEAAEILNVSTETLRRWDKTGKFKSVRHPINNYRVYTEEQVNGLVKDMQFDILYEINTKKIQNIQPFFETDYGKLYNQDAIEFLKTLNSNSVDLIFADPPYNIRKAEWDSFSSQKEYVEWSMDWIVEAYRVLKRTGTLYICGFSEILADIKWSASNLFKGCKWLIWFYRNKANLGSDWGRSHESILHFRKSKDFLFNIDPIRIGYNQHTMKYPKRPQAESSQYSNGKKKDYIWEPNPLGAKPKDVLEIPTISNGSWEKFTHKTQKPVELLRKIILSSSNNDSIIVDPFGGSGTTYAVAEAYKRNWIGSEINVEFCFTIKERITDRKHINRIYNAKDEIESQKRRIALRG